MLSSVIAWLCERGSGVASPYHGHGFGSSGRVAGKGQPAVDPNGCFTRRAADGMRSATHVGWNHPQTAHLNLDAGITWLYRVACLNPATSHVLREWDLPRATDLELRADLLSIFRAKNATTDANPLSRRSRRWRDASARRFRCEVSP